MTIIYNEEIIEVESIVDFQQEETDLFTKITITVQLKSENV